MQFKCSYTEIVSTNKLVPNPKNPNIHPREQVEKLAKIIDFQGQRSPVVVSKRSGFITKGHGRLEAMKLLKWESVAVDYQDYESEAQEFADMTADNAIAAWSELDKHLIYENLVDFPDLNLELLGIEGFDIGNIGEIDLPELSDADRSELEQMTYTFHVSQVDTVRDAITLVKKKYKEAYLNELNENSNGNAIAYICELFITQNK
jgi:hypothetical protein